MTTETSTQQQTTWTLDPAHTLVEFGVKHMMVTTVKGRFTEVSGTILLDEDNIENSQVDVRIGAASIDTRNEQRDGHLRSADFLDAENFPEITFKSTRIEPVGHDKLRITGDLTIRGTTREVTLDAEINGRGRTPYGTEVAGVSAATVLNRNDFGLTWNVALETGGVLVGPTAKVQIELEAVKQTAEDSAQTA